MSETEILLSECCKAPMAYGTCKDVLFVVCVRCHATCDSDWVTQEMIDSVHNKVIGEDNGSE